MPSTDPSLPDTRRAVPVAFRPSRVDGPREETSLLAFLSILLYHRRIIAICALAGLALFGASAMSEASLYLSRASFMVKGTRAPAQIPGGFASLTSGIAAAAEFSQSIVFYSDMVKSKTILAAVARKPYTTAEGARTTLAAMYGIKESDPRIAPGLAAERLLTDVSSSIYSRSGMVGIAAHSTDPAIAQQIAANILAELDAFSATRRRSQTLEERKFTEDLVSESRARLARAEEAHAAFARVNRDYENSPQLRVENDRLAREVSMQQQIYTAITQSYEQAKIEAVRDPSALSVVEPPDLPAQPQTRAALRKTLLGLAAGFFVGVVIAFLRQRAMEVRTVLTPGYMQFTSALSS